MMRRFCTLFDSKYVSKGLALHGSLLRHCSEPWTLDVLALDSETFWLLHALKFDNVRIHDIDSFETAMSMQPVRANRSYPEYCWTLASSFLEFLMGQNSYEELAYLDSDLFFFADPKIIFDEIGERSISIVPHRFSPDKRYLERNGLYNVGWISFKNTIDGQNCLGHWAENCRHWCYWKNENGKFADQGYLNDFERDYGDEVAVIRNIGVGVAPWNLQQYKLSAGPTVEGFIWNEGVIVERQPIVFFHFHEFKDEFNLTKYQIRMIDRALIYSPYIEAIHASKDKLLVS